MPKSSYDTPCGTVLERDRAFNEVALPWLKKSPRQLSESDAAALVRMVVDASATLVVIRPEVIASIAAANQPEAVEANIGEAMRALSEHPAEAGELLGRVGKWEQLQRKRKPARARRSVIAAVWATKGRGAPLDYASLEAAAKARGISLVGVSKESYRKAVLAVRSDAEKRRRQAIIRSKEPPKPER
jgi:hypothetical protein